MENKKPMNPFLAVLLGFGIAILSGLLIPVVVSGVLSLLGLVALCIACPVIGASFLLLVLIIGLPVYCITKAICHK